MLASELLRNRAWQLRRVPALPFVNVGCGRNIRPGFINVDYEWHPDIHLCWDIRRPLPLPDASAEGIFSEHCLEHVTYDDCLPVLRDLRRILKPGGVLRLIVPDGGLYLDLYHRSRQGEKVEFPYVERSGAADLAHDSRFGFTPMLAVNRIFRGYGHVMAYDDETLANLLVAAGFRNVERCSFRKGRKQALLIDTESRAPQSLYLEAE